MTIEDYYLLLGTATRTADKLNGLEWNKYNALSENELLRMKLQNYACASRVGSTTS